MRVGHIATKEIDNEGNTKLVLRNENIGYSLTFWLMRLFKVENTTKFNNLSMQFHSLVCKHSLISLNLNHIKENCVLRIALPLEHMENILLSKKYKYNITKLFDSFGYKYYENNINNYFIYDISLDLLKHIN